MVEKIKINNDKDKTDLNELIRVLEEVKKIKKEQIELYYNEEDFWYFDEEDECIIWDKKEKKFKKAKECRLCGTFTINDNGFCDDCRENLEGGKK